MSWWTRESPRQFLALPFAALCLLVPGSTLVKILAGWDIYAIGYLLLTWLAYRDREPSELRAMALASRRPGKHLSAAEELSQGAAAFALVATVIAMPQARTLDAPTALVLTVCVLAVLTSWLTLQTGFVIVYVGLHAEGGGLDFPGDDEPGLTDFVYFAVAVGTTFGATDVTVTQRRVRRRVTAHAVLAFFFNTLILAVAITLVASYIAAPK